MSNISQFNTKEKIQQLACLWISRIDRGLTNIEQKELVIWCNQNTNHHATLLEMASYWDDISVLNELRGLFPLERVKKSPSKFAAITLAASVAIILLLGTNALISESFLPFLPSLNEQSLTQNQTLTSPIGEQRSFTLSDGTHIKLNTNSIIEIAYTASFRQLTLVQGEARFDVTNDKSRPFTVTSGNKYFTALGTIFNVEKSDHQKMELMVTEGRVLITKATAALSVIKQTLLTANENTQAEDLPGILVISGEKAVIANQIKTPVKKISLDQVQRDLAWQQGMLIFDGESLSQALLEVSRYTSSQFKILDANIANVKVSGYFKANDVDGLLASLSSNFNISYRKSANNTFLITATK
ncbi:MAG: FecR domain-containing protein [Colwellia sp.]|nr:FecR domain-containing protein [Colwellia sp.]